MRSDLIWDDEARGLCIRLFPDNSQLFIFVYRIDDRQRFIRIGATPTWSLDVARKRAKKLRSIVDKGLDPATPTPDTAVENLIDYIAEHVRSE